MGNTVLRIVETFDGSKALQSNCRYIKGEYFEMNRQCFLMPDGKWHRINNGLIVFDHSNESWVLKTHYGLKQGIVNVDAKGNPVLGYFTGQGSKYSIRTKQCGKTYLFSDNLIGKLDLVEDIGTGDFHERALYPSLSVSKNFVGNKRVYSYNRHLDYNSDSTLDDNIFDYETNKIKGELDFFSDELDGTKWGLEIESWNGTIPQRHLPKVGLIPLLDGSLRHDGVTSYEYATVPLKGAQGLFTTKLVFDLVDKYTDIGIDCSLHIHMSGYEKTKEFIMSLYKLGLQVENEIYSLFPKYYKDTSQFKKKGKSYCGPLPRFELSGELDEDFNKYYNWLSMGESFKEFSNANHPSDPSAQHKWDIGSRYIWMNLVPFIWGKKQTIEFRVHPPTTNVIKAINWIFICHANLRYANLTKRLWNHERGHLTLQQIFQRVYDPTLAKYLSSYIKTLKENRKIADSINDYAGITWCENDRAFNFPDSELLTNHFEKCLI